MPTPYDRKVTEDLLVCTACGTQFPTADRASLKTCFICDDPRQFTPPTGQAFTTLATIRASEYKNTFQPYPPSSSSSSPSSDANADAESESKITSITTVPKLAIGQRCVLLRTPAGNVLWDCVTLLDGETESRIRALGGLGAIVISHPHYYTAHLEWARTFDCPVYVASDDQQWLAQRDDARQVFLTDVDTPILIAGKDTGARAIKLGGHFPGSMVLLFEGRLFIADTLVTTPAGLGSWGLGATGRPAGMNSFAFMWSIPNMIPLDADELARMWSVLRAYSFKSTHGAFVGTDIEDEANIKRRVLESMQIQVRYMGWGDHALVKMRVDE